MAHQNISKSNATQQHNGFENDEKFGNTLSPPPFQLMASSAVPPNEKQKEGESELEEQAMETPELSQGGNDGLRIPLEQKAEPGRKYMPFCDFIEKIQLEEVFHKEESTNIPLMITKLRKIFYGTSGWEDYLIPDRADIQGRYDVKDGAKTVKPIHWGLAGSKTVSAPQELRRREEDKDPATLDWMIPYQGQKDIYPQEVELPDGRIVDIGHVLAGLDALNFPTSVGHWSGLGPKVESSAGASTWIGDLASVIGETLLVHMERSDGEKTPMTEAEFQAQIDSQAPARDMMGNIDAYVIAANYDMSSIGEQTVSGILQDYYLGGKRETLKPYSAFAKQVGLGYLSTGLKGNEEIEWINKMSIEVSNAAVQYVALQMNTYIKVNMGLFNWYSTSDFFVLQSEKLLTALIDELHGKIIQEKKR